ncbi:acylneuraminate cytidylyltransferase family protein [Helicobacter cholecystus]|uniref:acylneuraminate cytidylyltransferase family protein n=1 Tax=Helicobacter cholecystus TaxID=45498 RepID=UPI0027386319|nr:acylneuraminate cytidylyltransferase family protein [Helicobacter cholecystus]
MYQDKSFLAIIPARSGSKGLPNKNIKNLCGHPLMAWSIKAGLKSKYIDKVVVTTDSEEYAEIAKSYGAEAPFLRPKELSLDTSTTFDSIKHTIDFYQNELQQTFDYIVLLEPTSPLREVEDIDNAIEILFSNQEASSIVGVCKSESQNPAFLIRLQPHSQLIEGYINKDFTPIRRQDIEDFYFFEGTIYVSEINALLKNQNFYHKNAMGYIVPKWKSLDVDDEDDFLMVETMMKKYILNTKEQ